MSGQHQVRPLSSGVLCNCCQPQPEMGVTRLVLESCTACASPAAPQLSEAERQGCAFSEGTES